MTIKASRGSDCGLSEPSEKLSRFLGCYDCCSCWNLLPTTIVITLPTMMCVIASINAELGRRIEAIIEVSAVPHPYTLDLGIVVHLGVWLNSCQSFPTYIS